MKSLYLKAIFAGLLMTVTSLSYAGLIKMEASYDSSSTATFSWDMTLDEADLNTQADNFQKLNSSFYDFIVSLNVIFTDSEGARFSLNLDELKAFDISMIYARINGKTFFADGANQRSKIDDINFSTFYNAFLSKGTDGGPIGRHLNVLINDDDDEFRLSSFKSVTVPEPSSLAIFALGIIGLLSRRCNK